MTTELYLLICLVVYLFYFIFLPLRYCTCYTEHEEASIKYHLPSQSIDQALHDVLANERRAVGYRCPARVCACTRGRVAGALLPMALSLTNNMARQTINRANLPSSVILCPTSGAKTEHRNQARRHRRRRRHHR